MNEDALNDPTLQSLEARLAASAPQLSTDEQHQLLYACAFAAGQRSAVRSTRQWQAITLTLGLIVVGLTYSQIPGPAQVARAVPIQNESPQVGMRTGDAVDHPKDSISESYEALSSVKRSPNVRLDAWQRAPSTTRSDSTKLAQQSSFVTAGDGLTVGGLNLGALD